MILRFLESRNVALIFSTFLWPPEPFLQYPCVRAQYSPLKFSLSLENSTPGGTSVFLSLWSLWVFLQEPHLEPCLPLRIADKEGKTARNLKILGKYLPSWTLGNLFMSGRLAASKITYVIGGSQKGQKIGAARKVSKSILKLFDDF